jgi:hypothetical protein
VITEVLQSQGSWEVTLAPTTPINLWNQIQKFGHLVVHSQYTDPSQFSDADMLSAARYVGPLFTKEIDYTGIRLSGSGMIWWLGDADGKGQLIEQEVKLEGATLEYSLDQVLPDAVVKGTIVEPGTTYTGVHQWETPLEAVRTICTSLGCEFRVNNDGTLDAGPKESLFVVTNPRVVVTAGSGKDPVYLAVDSEQMALSFDAEPYATRVIVVTEDSDNVRTLVGYVDRIPMATETDIHGNELKRVYMVETFGQPVSVATYVLAALNDRSEVAEINISTMFRDMAEGSFHIGDGFWAWDPPAFVDQDNEITFRGDIINPRLLRLLSASWGVHSGMGVYYRTPEIVPEYIDLTRFIVPEDETSRGMVNL